MADVAVDNAEITRVSSLLSRESVDIVNDLKGLSRAVNALLADPAGGLYLRKASPVLTASFSEFAGKLEEAIKNIESFAKSFGDISKNLNDMDAELAKPPAKK
jgi:hypothetical protein